MELETDPPQMQNESQEERKPSWSYTPRRRRIMPGDAFFDDGNDVSVQTHKQMPLENQDTDEGQDPTSYADFKCHILGCHHTFTTVHSYEVHYNGVHRNICRYCRRSYPSNHLLDVHILESHDSLFEVMAQTRPMYQCLVESCSERFADSHTRREHLIKMHHYPADFRFQKGLSKNRPHVKSKVPPTTSDDSMDTALPTEGDTHSTTHTDAGSETALDDDSKLSSTTSESSKQRQYRVPGSISFGRGGTRSFQRAHQRRENKPNKTKAQKHGHHTPRHEPMDMVPTPGDDAGNPNERTEEPMS